MKPNAIEPVEVLLVEDNPADVQLMREMLEESKILTSLHVVMDGEEALDYLHRREGFADAPRPDMILLDLNLPKKSGLVVLEAIKEDPDLRRTPVVVMTTSEEEKDILESYDHHANSYVTKPLDFEQFLDVMKAIEGFWFGIVKFPPKR